MEKEIKRFLFFIGFLIIVIIIGFIITSSLKTTSSILPHYL